MCPDDASHESFDERVRSIAREVSRSLERSTQVDLAEVTEAMGLDPDRARELVNNAMGWLRTQAEGAGDLGAFGNAAPADDAVGEEPLRSAGPHPLDLPTDQQGTALAALDSGRWTVQQGSHTLVTHGEGPEDGDASELVDELRGRDWIAADGEVTLVGRHALRRWLESADPR